jgi:hypothetical protein
MSVSLLREPDWYRLGQHGRPGAAQGMMCRQPCGMLPLRRSFGSINADGVSTIII